MDDELREMVKAWARASAVMTVPSCEPGDTVAEIVECWAFDSYASDSAGKAWPDEAREVYTDEFRRSVEKLREQPEDDVVVADEDWLHHEGAGAGEPAETAEDDSADGWD